MSIPKVLFESLLIEDLLSGRILRVGIFAQIRTYDELDLGRAEYEEKISKFFSERNVLIKSKDEKRIIDAMQSLWSLAQKWHRGAKMDILLFNVREDNRIQELFVDSKNRCIERDQKLLSRLKKHIGASWLSVVDQ